MPKKSAKKMDTEAPKLEKLLEVRKTIAEHRPVFLRPESWRYVRIHPEWRKPKGMDNKIRKSFKGYPKRVKVGYRGPHEVRGYHSSGHTEVLVYNTHDLMKAVPEKDVVRIGRTVGGRKRVEILKRASELGLRVLNPQRLRVIEPKK